MILRELAQLVTGCGKSVDYRMFGTPMMSRRRSKDTTHDPHTERLGGHEPVTGTMTPCWGGVAALAPALGRLIDGA
jgi:hypothetical protein